MPEEIYYAPRAGTPVLKLDTLLSKCAERGCQAQVEIDSPEMCWVYFEGLDSQFVVSTSSGESKEIGLVTFEVAGGDDEDAVAELSGILESLGLSSDPDAQYR